MTERLDRLSNRPKVLVLDDQQKLEVWTKELTLDRLMGSEKLLVKVMKIFSRSYSQHLADIKASIDKQDMSEVAKTCHGFRGICGEIGAQRVQHLLAQMEQNARAEQATFLFTEQFTVLENEVSEFVKQIKPYLDTK